MLHKTQGIVFKYIKYRESSIIVSIFTEAFGIQSYVVNGVRSSKSTNNKIALFQPLTCLDLVVYFKESSSLHRISEIKCNPPFRSIPIDIRKSSIALFLTEFLSKIIKEQHDTETLFTFIQQSVLVLDHLDNGFENFHIQFLVKLSSYLGFGISENNELELLLQEDRESYSLLNQLNETSFDNHLKVSNTMRLQLLHALLYYYKQHYPTLNEIKSLNVLREVLH